MLAWASQNECSIKIKRAQMLHLVKTRLKAWQMRLKPNKLMSENKRRWEALILENKVLTDSLKQNHSFRWAEDPISKTFETKKTSSKAKMGITLD